MLTGRALLPAAVSGLETGLVLFRINLPGIMIGTCNFPAADLTGPGLDPGTMICSRLGPGPIGACLATHLVRMLLRMTVWKEPECASGAEQRLRC